jgi:hypothetical protein
VNPQLGWSQALQSFACGFTRVSLNPLGGRIQVNRQRAIAFLASAFALVWTLVAPFVFRRAPLAGALLFSGLLILPLGILIGTVGRSSLRLGFHFTSLCLVIGIFSFLLNYRYGVGSLWLILAVAPISFLVGFVVSTVLFFVRRELQFFVESTACAFLLVATHRIVSHLPIVQ